jgi:hypothetical protein
MDLSHSEMQQRELEDRMSWAAIMAERHHPSPTEEYLIKVELTADDIAEMHAMRQRYMADFDRWMDLAEQLAREDSEAWLQRSTS